MLLRPQLTSAGRGENTTSMAVPRSPFPRTLSTSAASFVANQHLKSSHESRYLKLFQLVALS